MNTGPITVLIIEDNPADAKLISELLRGTDSSYRIETAPTITEGLDKIKSVKPGVILLDLTLPDSKGINSLDIILPVAGDIPVIVLTGINSETLSLEAVQKGAQDYLVKGQANGHLLHKSISYSMERKTIERKLKASEERARAISDSSMDAIIVIDGKGAITYFNDSAEKVFGFTKEESFGLKLHDLIVSQTAKEKYHRKLPNFDKTGTCSVVGKTLEVNATRKDGSRFPIELSISSFQMHGQWHSVGSIRDITKRKKLETKLREAAITDELTGILNRRGFFALADQQCKLATRSNKIISLLYLDIDNMKSINDQFSHKAGDAALQETARLLQQTYRGSDVIARIGGDEFAVVLTDSSADFEKTITQHLEDNLAKLNNQQDREFTISLSMGISHFNPATPCSIDNLLTTADILMYEHKKSKFAANIIESLRGEPAEKRTCRRYEGNNKCTADINNSTGLTIKDISLGGLCYRTDEKLSAGSQYEIYLVSHANKKIHCTGKVIWSTLIETDASKKSPSAVYESGVQFVNMSSTQAKSLKALMCNTGIQSR